MSVGALNAPPVSSLWDDPLVLLPRRKVQHFQKDQTIYTPEDPAESLLLVVDGIVKLSRLSHAGRETVLEFSSRDDFFGESCLLGKPSRGEMAVALEAASIMEWPLSDLEQIMVRTPELAPSLLRVLTQKLRQTEERIESLAIDQIAQRLIKALLHLGEQLGTPVSGSVVHILPVTHELLAKYVGTSREIITQHMSQLRKKGLLTYSRAGIEFDPVELNRQIAEV